MNNVTLLGTMAREARYAIRTLRQKPIFSAAALLTLTIGIGTNTAVFSVVNSVLLKPLPYPRPDQLVSLRQMAPGAAGLADVADGLLLSPSMYFTYAEHNRTFVASGVWTSGTANVTGLAEPEEVRIVAVSDGLLQTLAVSPVLGRWFSQQDQLPHEPETAMLSYGYWQRRFGGDRSVIGRNIRVDSRPRQIVGVMPRGFRVVTADFDVLLPQQFDRSKLILAGFGYHGIARLKPGIPMGQANADMARMLPIWMDSWSNGPGTDPRWYLNWRITPDLRSLKEKVVGNISSVLWVVMGTLAMVMLIACANVANLMLVRADSRQTEFAIRAALGAGTGRIVGGLLLESVLLGLIGGVLGIGLAYESLRLLVAVGPQNLPRLNEISLDARALVFTLLISVFSGLIFGLIPAIRYAGPRIAVALHSSGRTASDSRERHSARDFLVIAQVAMALVLLVAAGLMIRTFEALRKVEPGIRGAHHLQTMRISIPDSLISDPRRVTRTQNDILDKLKAIPGVTSAAFASEMPMEGFGTGWDLVYAEGKNYPGEVSPLRMFIDVSPGYFHTTGSKIVAGRELTWPDVYGGRPVAIVSENLAREFWGTPAAAIGKRMREFRAWVEVIGVVEDVRENGVQEPAPAIVYWPCMRNLDFPLKPEIAVLRTGTFVVRSDLAGTEGLLNEMRQAVWSVNPSVPVASVRTMADIANQSMARTSFTLVMLASAGAMALVLGIIGIYGVISYSVSQRRREIGIRMALGAQHSELKKMFVRSALVLAGIGSALGIVTAIGLTRLMKSVLFGISPLDPLTYMAVPVALALAAVLASYVPARRAAAVDPVEALRAE